VAITSNVNEMIHLLINTKASVLNNTKLLSSLDILSKSIFSILGIALISPFYMNTHILQILKHCLSVKKTRKLFVRNNIGCVSKRHVLDQEINAIYRDK
jgi:hypothetical protein